MGKKSRIKRPQIFRWLGMILVLILLAGSLITITACAHRRNRAVVVTESGDMKVVYVQKAPPHSRDEVRPKKPSPKAVWIPGYWKWKGNKYVWIPGYWERNPRGKVWEPGKWVKKPGGWVWVPGRWR